MKHYQGLNYLPIFLTLIITSCQSCINTTPMNPEKYISQEAIIDSNSYHDFCDYFYSRDTLRDTLHFDFEERDDFGPVYLSNNELKQIYCEIKRGNIDAYKILCTYYFYSYSPYIPKSEVDKLICITDFLAIKYCFYEGYLICGNYILDYLRYNADDYYTTIMITYYETYFEHSKSKNTAQKLYEIYCGNYSFHDKDLVKAKYYKKFIDTN